MAKNPDPGPMKDTTTAPPGTGSGWNHGFEQTSGSNGQSVIRAFGLDRSGEVGTQKDERNGMRDMGGGINNLDHSLKGVSANQTGRSRG